jgi:uncharacterized protein
MPAPTRETFGLSAKSFEQLIKTLGDFPAIEVAVIYGSRAKGTHRLGSDIDLTLHGSSLTTGLLGQIADAIDELLLPYTVDLSLFSELNHAELQSHIERVGKVLYSR